MDNKHLLNLFSHQVNLYLDNRLDEDSSRNLLNVIDENKDCCNVFNKEKNFREFVKNNVKRPSASVELINIIRQKLG